ncbi:MAG: P-II family nitrogen regulator [Clostridiales bacterium]|nr:P-II family nitrogen regulator [Clostridiales bacterium]
MEFAHEVIICIVNTGFSDAVMDAAKSAGARGGTVMSARGTADKEAEKFFNISIQPEKELVMIIVKTEIRDAVLHALYKAVGIGTPAQGIAFAMPVDAVVGLKE